MFEPAKAYALLAAKKYRLEGPALGALVCEKAKQVVATEYPRFCEDWVPQKFNGGSLTIRAMGSSGGELFLRTQSLLEKLNQCDLPAKVQQIKIVKA